MEMEIRNMEMGMGIRNWKWEIEIGSMAPLGHGRYRTDGWTDGMTDQTLAAHARRGLMIPWPSHNPSQMY